MTYLFYLFICIFLILVQTTILPNCLYFEKFYDLLIPFILYLGLFRPFGEGLPIILLLGFVMDSISGSPFGLYLTTYFWLFVAMRWVIQYLHSGSFILLPLVVFMGVLMENIIFIMVIAILEPDWKFLTPALNAAFGQLLWVIITGPLFFVFTGSIHQKLEKWHKERSAERNGSI